MHRRRFLRRIGAAGGVAATTALAGCSSVGGEPGYDVGMVADGYRPAELTVAVGDTVVWENTSARTHTVTAYEGGIPEAADYFASGGFDDEKNRPHRVAQRLRRRVGERRPLYTHLRDRRPLRLRLYPARDRRDVRDRLRGGVMRRNRPGPSPTKPISARDPNPR